jgi:ketosteroid isomerase-like protein
MKRTNVVAVCVMFVLLFTTSVAFSQYNSEYKSKIESINKDMIRDMLNGDTEATLSLYTNDAISMPSYAPIREGISAIREASIEMAKKGVKYNSFDLTTLKVIPEGNLITEIGTYKLSLTMAGVDKPIDDHGKYLTVWEKQKDGSLKVKIETWNSDIDPMNMMKSSSYINDTEEDQ